MRDEYWCDDIIVLFSDWSIEQSGGLSSDLQNTVQTDHFTPLAHAHGVIIVNILGIKICTQGKVLVYQARGRV